MPKRKRIETDAVIERRLREGRGSGEGKDYKPWLTIHDVASRGRVHRIRGCTTGRVHHLLSDGELHCLLLADFDPRILDFREQYPLPLDVTLEVAEQIGAKHPIDPKRGGPRS